MPSLRESLPPASIRPPLMSQSFILLRKIKAGDKQAVDTLFRRYSDRLLGIIRFKLHGEMRSKVEPMDVLQEVLMLALEKIKNFEPRAQKSLLRWFSVIIERRILDLYDHFRAAKRDLRAECPAETTVQRTDRSSLLSERLGFDKTPSQILATSDEKHRIESALDLLTPEQKELILLRVFDKLAFHEIGQRKGKSPDAVRMGFSRAMAKLTILLRKS